MSAAIEALRRPLGKDKRPHQVCRKCKSVLRPHRLKCIVCGAELKGDGTISHIKTESEE